MKILICTNGREYSNQAIKSAGEIFNIKKPQATLFYVNALQNVRPFEELIPPKEAFKKGKEILKNFGMTAKIKIKKNKEPSSVIISEVSGSKYDLLVMGSRGVSGIIPGVSQYILGDIPREVIPKVNISTLIVKELDRLEKILICIDESIASKKALEFWGKLEQEQRKKNKEWKKHRIILLNVIPELYERFKEILEPMAETQLGALGTLPDKRTQDLYEAKEILNNYGIKSEIRLRTGDIAEEILREAEREYDLIVMGRSGRKGRIVGPHTERIVEQSKISTLIVKE